MKTQRMKKTFRKVFCASMAAIFVMSDMVPVASAQDTAAETAPAPTDTKQVIGFESVNPVEYYELEYGGSHEDLEIPDKIRVVTELPEDIQLSTFEEGQVPEQQDELLPKYEYSHTVDKLMLETADEVTSLENMASQETEQTKSQGEESASSSETAEDAGASGESVEVSTEEAQELLDESSKISYNSTQVYSFTDDKGEAHYRVYGSVDEKDPQWYAVDENGIVLGAVEELDANWDFSQVDSSAAGQYQVKVQLPDNYILSQGVELAYIQVVVTQENGEPVSSENEDGSLPSVMSVSDIAARSDTNSTQAVYPVTIEREGSAEVTLSSFGGGVITSATVPDVENYIFIEELDSDGTVTSNGASLRVTDGDGVVTSYNNVTAMYPVSQDDSTTTWFYTTTLSDGKVAWEVPPNADLVFRYQPDPDAQNAFTKVTITSDDWKDGSASGNYTEGYQDYTAYVPIDETVSIEVDLPSLYTAYQDNISYTNIQPEEITTSNTRTQLTAEWGPTALRNKWINDTVTFKFTVPELNGDGRSEGVVIKLHFLSYMREYYDSQDATQKRSTEENLWLRINQRYPTPAPYPGNGSVDAEWRGQRAIRIFEQIGTVEFRYNSQFNIQYESNKETGTYSNISKTAYQNLGPEALASDMNAATSNWRNIFSQDGTARNQQTYWSEYDSNIDGNGPNSMQVDAYAMQIVESGQNRRLSSKEIASNEDDERTLFFVFENTLRNLGPSYSGTWDPMSMSGQDLPIGVMLYTQNHNTGIFVPLESKLSMSDPDAQGIHDVMAEVEIAGMKVKVTRENYDVEDYNTNMNTTYWPGRGTAKVRKWTYTIQVQGATGYLGADFVTSIDTQSRVSLMSVSPNVEKVELLATQSGDPWGNPLAWQTVDSGRSLYVYQLGNNSGGTGQNNTTFDDFYDGAWNTSYYGREGALPIRIKQKVGYGIPYLKFTDSSVSDPKKLIAGITNTNIDSETGSSSLTITRINNQANKTVRGRIQDLNGDTSSTLDGEVVEYLFGFRDGNNTWQGWSKVTSFSVEADPKILVISYDTDGGGATGDITSTTTTWGNGYYVTTPSSTPTPPSGRGYFIGWKIKLSDGSFLQDSDGDTIYLLPNQTIATTDQTYFPEDRLPVGHGADYDSGSGYFNASVVTLVADYSNSVSDGQMITGDVIYYTQSGVNAAASTNTGYIVADEQTATAPYKQRYYVVRDDTYTDNNVDYIFNEPVSLYSGTAGDVTDGSSTILGKLYYDKAIEVSYNIDTDGKPEDETISTPTDNNNYTTVNGNQNIITLQTLNGLTDESAEAFQGWTVKGDNVLIPKTVTSINLDYHDAPDITTIDNNNNTARLGKSTIEKIYTAGVVQLDATWDNLQPVTLEGGKTDNDAANNQYTKVLVKTGTNHTFTVTAKFKYDDTAENFEKIKGEDKLFIALYQQDSSSNGNADGTGGFSFLKGSRNVTTPTSETSLVTKLEISELNDTDKTFTVTFTVTDNANLTTANGYSSYNHKDYQIVAWTSANKSDSFTDTGAAASLGDTQDDTNVPQVRSKIYVQKPIAVTTGYDNRTEKFYENTGSFTTSFAYDARPEFTGSDATVNYAIYRVQGGDNALGICEAGTISLANGNVTRVTDNGLYLNTANVTATPNNGELQLNITLNDKEGRTRSIYRGYVWNESNGDANVLSDGSISAAHRRSDSGLSGYPLSSTTILKIPKVYTSSTTEISQRTTNKMFYDGDPLTISATFTLEGGKTSDNTGDRKETISNLLTDPENRGELKIALYKVNPSGKGVEGYQLFALAQSNGSGSLSTTYKASTIGDAAITTSGDRGFTVTFTKINGEYQWDDGASYYIYAWTGANVQNNALPGNFGTGGDNTIVANENIVAANSLIPSVKNSMLGILTNEHFGEIIYYPKQIAMMDNVKPNNKHIFSANQKITMTPLKVEEGGQMVDAEVPNPDSGVDVVIKEIRDNRDAQNSIQVSRTVGSGNETINLTCFLGTIESGTAPMISTSGKVGTLYFADTLNELPLYFRSSGSNPPDVADGAPFTGQIHFIFSKSASGN